jgi:predicted AlkP superfamily phosphohydrolase/phosphomutase
MERGARGPLQTIEPTVSPAIWTTLATGKLPEAHGILGFDGVPGQSMRTLPTSQMRRVRAFWNILTEHDRSVGLIGWWATWPAEEVRGYVVSDRVAYTRMEATIADEEDKPHEIYPEQIASEVKRLVRSPGEITAAEVRRFMSLDDSEIERLIRGAEYRHADFLPEFKYVHQADRTTTDIALHLMGERPTDVTAVAFYGVDAMSHLTWHFMAPSEFPEFRIDERALRAFGGVIESYYEFVDGMIGELIEAADPATTVIVFSDHGFGPTGAVPFSGGHGKITPGAPVAPDGVLILAGPHVRRGAIVDRPHVLDLTPTLLYMMGIPPAADMPGRVWIDALDESFVAVRPLDRVATYETSPRQGGPDEVLADPELDRATIDKLRSLGYLD